MRCAGVLCLLPLVALAAEPVPQDWYRVIRENKLPALKAMAGSKSAVNAADSRGVTPLMQAAAVGSIDAMKILLAAGADVNARSGLEITPLLYGATNPAKVRLLVEAGADVNAKSKFGRTALIVAAGCPGGSESVRLLLSKGANPKVKDNAHITPLVEAARVNDFESLRLLLDHPAEIDEGDRFGYTPLLYAASRANLAATKLLLDKGADPNASHDSGLMVRNGPIALSNITPLMMAPMSSLEVIQTLLDHGARVNARDGRGMTALMFAAATERPNPAVVRLLLKAGADPEIESKDRERARDWAAKFNQPEIMKLLNAHRPAEPESAITAVFDSSEELRQALGRSVALLQATSSEYFKQSGCVGCHHQPFIGMATDHAMRNSVAVDAAARRAQTQVVRTENLSNRDLMLQGVFLSVDSLASFVLHFSEAGQPADEVTDALVSAIASQQKADGSWYGAAVVRPPLEDSTWVRTAMAVKALASYPIPARRVEFEARVARARKWLAESKPDVAYERSFRLLGRVWSGAQGAEVARVASDVRKLQRTDGGWGQIDQLRAMRSPPRSPCAPCSSLG